MPASGLEEINLDFTPEGTASTDWWTEQASEILSSLGPPAPGFEELNQNPWCG
jgi:hypothetical protein